MSPFAHPEAQLEPQQSQDGSQPTLAIPVTPEPHTRISAGQHSPGNSGSPSFRPSNEHDSLSGGDAAQPVPPSGSSNGVKPSDQSSRPTGQYLAAEQKPNLSTHNSSADAASPSRPPVTNAEQKSSFSQPLQARESSFHSSGNTPISQSTRGVGSREQRTAASSSCAGQSHSWQQNGMHEPPGSPTMDDVLLGRSAATDRAALQELLDIKAPVQVS